MQMKQQQVQTQTQTSTTTTSENYGYSEPDWQREERIEKERLERERREALRREKAIAHQLEMIESDYDAYCDTNELRPPKMLLSAENDAFEQFVSLHRYRYSGDETKSAAFERFKEKGIKLNSDVVAKLSRVKRKLFFKEKLTLSIRSRRLLKQVNVATSPPNLRKSQLDSFLRNTKYVSEQWENSGRKEPLQGSISIARDEANGRSIVQMCAPEFGTIYLTIPSELDPTEVAQDVLGLLSPAVHEAISDCNPLVVLNGDAQGTNLKRVVQDRIVLRATENTERKLQLLKEKVQSVFAQAPLNSDNTDIVSGLPVAPEELTATFSASSDTPDWDVWSEVAPTWHAISESGLAPVAPSRSANQFLEALTTKKNVIVLVAHAETGAVYFPEPAPDGTEVKPEDILALREEIELNEPNVYLFCCETAKFSAGAASIKNALLQAGAQSVVAPQIRIDAITNASLFKEFLKKGAVQTPLKALLAAEKSTKNRDMEVWLV